MNKKLANQVEGILSDHPATRDSDDKLYSFILNKHMLVKYGGDMPAKELLKLMWKGKLPKYESITRVRRKLQEENPTLRGNRWNARHKKAEEIRLRVVNGELF